MTTNNPLDTFKQAAREVLEAWRVKQPEYEEDDVEALDDVLEQDLAILEAAAVELVNSTISHNTENPVLPAPSEDDITLKPKSSTDVTVEITDVEKKRAPVLPEDWADRPIAQPVEAQDIEPEIQRLVSKHLLCLVGDGPLVHVCDEAPPQAEGGRVDGDIDPSSHVPRNSRATQKRPKGRC